jgi:HlyD family secretion protein
MKRIILIVLLLLAGAVVAWLVWHFTHPARASHELVLYGNVDLRQVDLAFNDNQRIATVLVQEGDHVKRGQTLARLDVSRLEPMVAQAAAQVEAQRAVVDRLHNGSRPEEIAQARANVDSAKADAENAKLQYQRITTLQSSSTGRAISQQDIDNAKAALDVALARVELNQKALDLAVVGPRKEDIAQGEAQLQALEAQLAFARQQLTEATLVAPVDAVVRSRLLEPGDMASPTKPVFTLAITDPKWVRAYVSEPDLGKVHPGMAASVTADSFPDRHFDGWIGFVSSVAEFTPKPVETTELRTKLVYEVRAFVNDPRDEMRLGMPATVRIDLNLPAAPVTRPAVLTAATAPYDATTRGVP